MPQPVRYFNIPQIVAKAGEFIKEWQHRSGNEIQLAASFITGIFGIFDMKPLDVGMFEYPAPKPDGKRGRVDYLAEGWHGIEMKAPAHPHLNGAWE
jgi:hypothetical protein